jgi:hypothetical protein
MSKSEKDIKEIFHEMYDYKQFGKHTTNQSLQKKIERHRNQLCVDFYNLDPKDTKQIEAFSDKYVHIPDILIARFGNSTGVHFDAPETPLDITRAVSTTRGLIRHEQRDFRVITDKILAGNVKEITKEELEHINYSIFHTFKLGDIDNYQLRQSFHEPCEIYTSLYEWVILVAHRQVDVDRCAAEDCDHLFIPYKSGNRQIFCSSRCRVRQHNKNKYITA